MTHYQRLNVSKNKTSWKRRILTHDPNHFNDILEAQQALPLLEELIILKSILGLPISNEESASKHFINSLISSTTVPQEYFSKLARFSILKRNRNVYEALEDCMPHGVTLFLQRYGFYPREIIKLAPVIIGDEISLKAEKRGVVSQEFALLLLLKRTHTGEKETELAQFFGGDPALISSAYRAALLRVRSKWQNILSLDTMGRFQLCLQEWNESFNSKVLAKCGTPMSALQRFADANVIIDGHRLLCCASPLDNDILMNPYIGNLPNLLFLLVIGGNGLVVGLSACCGGVETDTSLALEVQLEEKLLNAGMVALGDGIFGHSEAIRPLPRGNQTHIYSNAELAAMSSVRVVVEWGIGEIVAEFPIFEQANKSQIFGTMPATEFWVATFMRNIKKCLHGCNANSYLGTRRTDLGQYLGVDFSVENEDEEE